MRRDLLCAAVAAFLMLSGHAFALQNAQGQPSQNQAQQQQEQQAAPASPRHLRAAQAFIAIHTVESCAADNRFAGSGCAQGARAEERSGGRETAASLQQRQYSNAGRRLGSRRRTHAAGTRLARTEQRISGSTGGRSGACTSGTTRRPGGSNSTKLHKKLEQDQADLDIMQRELGVLDVQYYNDPVKAMQQGYSRSDINEKTDKIEAKKKTDRGGQSGDLPTPKKNCTGRRRSRLGALEHFASWNRSSLSKTKPNCGPCSARRWNARATPWKKLRTEMSAIEKVRGRRYLLVLSDLKLPGSSGLDVLRESRQVEATLPVILMTAYGSVEEAVTAMKEGAFDFIQKPVDLDHLKLLVERAAQQQELLRENLLLREEYAVRYGFPRIVGEHPAMKDASQMTQRVAATDSTVLAAGRKRHGQGSFSRARFIILSPRAEHPFVALNCAAIPEGLVENELFGHERGAYTGRGRAQNRQDGAGASRDVFPG